MKNSSNSHHTTHDLKRGRLNYKYHVRNVINSFLFMALLVCFSTLGTVSLLKATNEKIPYFSSSESFSELLYFSIILVIFYTVWQLVFTRLIIERPTKEFAKASEKVVQGDYSVRIDTENLRLGSLEFINIAQNFNIMVEQLGRVDSLSNDFISNVSHELKTPLAVIQSYATILQNPDLSEDERKEYTDKILISTQQLSVLVSNILKLNKVENNELCTKKERYNLSCQLSQSLLDMESLWEEKGINIDFDVEDDVYIDSDKELLQIVWTNLFSNAIKFTPKGGNIGVKLQKHTDRIMISINDTGCGMSEETISHIFEKFYQGDTSHSEKGNGLGLSLVKRIIDLTGSEISVESELGKGTTFTITLYN
ncbi:cell wall metabolism sensor histidine kinase WalK [uncultured Eubacterium sp.]|uniref:sensor histidine kinase n=1 Tax=uncultured Eubacterium sp. TaxID=165185 RepID=UPI00261108FA|nr:HAMP domain-containing sensor histidine kinase [uncultured Eubacterium sp.]